nr:MFS transporter [Gordonia araii]
MTGQTADGIFQAALFAAIAFNPDHQATPLLMAGSLAVLVGPYSLIGPWVGTLLDHWDRRLVLLWANVIRAGLIVVSAALLASSLPEGVVLASALGVMGASRFVGAGLSAALPHVTSRESLVTDNAVFTTLGGFAVVIGLGIAAGARLIVGGDDVGSALTMLIGAGFALTAGLLARSFPARSLGPDDGESPPASLPSALANGWRRGAAAVVHTPTVAVALAAIGAHRWVFGMNSLVLLVLANHAGVSTGLRRFLLLAGATAVGALLAALTTPILARRIGRGRTLASGLAVGVLAQSTLLTFNLDLLVGAAVVLGWVGQTVKLCGDVAMQLDIADDIRGEVFALQDAVFNLTFVAAVFTTAVLLPDDGRATGLVLLGAVVYAAALVGVVRRHPATIR